MIAAGALWSIIVARSRGLPSSLIATAALASPGPMEAASSAPLTGPENSRRAPSGKVIVSGPGDAGFMISAFSLIELMLCQRDGLVRRGDAVTKQPRPVPGGAGSLAVRA